jgi:signal transduction histidine kinase
VRSRLARAYELWESRQERDVIEPGTTLSAWLATSIAIYAIILGCLVTGEFPGGSLWRALVAPGPVILEGFMIAIVWRRRLITWSTFLACNVVGSALLIFALASLALLAAGRTSFLFVAFTATVATLHGWNTKSSVEAPIMALAAICGIALAEAFTVSHDWVLVAMMAVATLYSSLMMGTWSARAHARLIAHREAIQAGLLEEHARRNRSLRSGLTHMLSLRHDQRNLAQSVALDLGDLEAGLESPQTRDSLRAISSTFEQLRELLAAAPPDDEQSVAGAESGVEAVSLANVAADVLGIVRSRYSRVHLESLVRVDLPLLLLRGGALSLRRILLNLLLNACEGDGRGKGATRVTLAAERDRTGTITVLTVTDDGPGFPSSILKRRVPFLSSKPEGSGLGLFTVESHVRACGGEIRYANLAGGGAEVTVELPVARE